MSLGRSLRSMDFMMSAAESMVILVFGSVSSNFLTIFPSRQLCKTNIFVCMGDCRQALKLWTTLDL